MKVQEETKNLSKAAPAFGKRKAAVQQVRDEKEDCKVSSTTGFDARNGRRDRENGTFDNNFNDHQKGSSFGTKNQNHYPNGGLVV